MKIRGFLAVGLAVGAIITAGCAASTAGVPTVPGTGSTTPPSTTTPRSTTTTSGPSRGPGIPGPPLQVVQDAELLALETQTGGPQGWRGSSRFVESGPWQEYLKSLGGYDGDPHPIAQQVPAVPDGKVLVAGVVSISCDKPGGAVLGYDGSSYRLVATDLPQTPTPECYAPFVTVAVMSAPLASVPAGSVGPGTLVHFSTVETSSSYRPGAVELTDADRELSTILPKDAEAPDLPEPADGQRRYAFLLTACRAEAAAVEIGDKTVSAHIDPPAPDPVECVVAQPFLAVFDVPDTLVPADARPTS